LPDKIISYTYPFDITAPPFRDVLYYAHHLLDTVTVYRATQERVDELENFTGIPRSKIVWGVAIGCNGEFYKDVPLGDAMNIANDAKDGGYAGVTIWSLNRDTDHRSNSNVGVCGVFQTGRPDGTYIGEMSKQL